MKKLILVVTITVLGILACKEREETPAPIVKKYEYKRTSGEVTKIEGDIFVDTGGTVFTVKGKGFDPKKKKYYHFMMMRGQCDQPNTTKFKEFRPGTIFSQSILDTARLMSINDSVIKFWVYTNNIYSTRAVIGEANCLQRKDTVDILFGVSSNDSTDKSNIVSNFDVLKTQKAPNKLFFNILKDTLIWQKSLSQYNYKDYVITLDDIRKDGSDDKVAVDIYFNSILLNAPFEGSNYVRFDNTVSTVGDGAYVFAQPLYDQNKSLNLVNGFYNITMKDVKTGLPIEEKHGKKGVYVKFIN